MTDEITLISKQGLTDETYKRTKAFFSEDVIAQTIMAIVVITGWNRIAISTQLTVA